MKRVKSGCIMQTLIFSQKPELGFSKEQALEANRAEILRYKRGMERTDTKYQITDETVQEDGSVVLHVKKQLNERTDISEYFN